MPTVPTCASHRPADREAGARGADPGARPVAAALLPWYDRHARSLPWRRPPGASRGGGRPDPYRVWLSEIMLQQTTVAAVAPRYGRFLAVWPDVESLARASEADVLREWAGLGYYSRARNLHACAREVVARHGARFPRTAKGLRALPGVGEYTAAAVAAIAFGEAAPVVDGNVERMVSRVAALPVPPARAKAEVRRIVGTWVPADRPGDFAQATMDLGATICTPRSPACAVCPLLGLCDAQGAGEPERYPVKAPRKERPARVGAAFVARRSDGALLMTRRPARGLLGGTASVPMSDWSARADGDTGAARAPLAADWRAAGVAEHGFTHFSLTLHVHAATVEAAAPEGHWWSADPEREGLTTLVRRVLEVADAA